MQKENKYFYQEKQKRDIDKPIFPMLQYRLLLVRIDRNTNSFLIGISSKTIC
jgi:hypothetical protein